MIGMAIALLWFLIAVIILAGVIWLVLYGLKTIAEIAIPPRVEQGAWFIFLLLVLIYALTIVAGGGSSFSLSHFR